MGTGVKAAAADMDIYLVVDNRHLEFSHGDWFSPTNFYVALDIKVDRIDIQINHLLIKLFENSF